MIPILGSPKGSTSFATHVRMSRLLVQNWNIFQHLIRTKMTMALHFAILSLLASLYGIYFFFKTKASRCKKYVVEINCKIFKHILLFLLQIYFLLKATIINITVLNNIKISVMKDKLFLSKVNSSFLKQEHCNKLPKLLTISYFI